MTLNDFKTILLHDMEITLPKIVRQEPLIFQRAGEGWRSFVNVNVLYYSFNDNHKKNGVDLSKFKKNFSFRVCYIR
jgi:hypothetical protein